jgi:hypothetical protein
MQFIYTEELHNLYSSPSIIRMIKSRRMRCAGHVAQMGEKRNAYRILVEKPEGKRPLRRPRHRWEDNIKIDLVERYGLDSPRSGWKLVEGSCEHGNEPSDFIRCWQVSEELHNWRLLTKGSAP